MSPLSDVEDVHSEDDEDSTFHREIILQDNYSDTEASDHHVDTDGAAAVTGIPQAFGQQEEAGTRHVASAARITQEPERRVKFAPDLVITPSSSFITTDCGAVSGGFGTPSAAGFVDASVTHSPTDAAKKALLSFLPSRIVGNAVEMSKYVSEFVAAHPDLEGKLQSISDPDKRKEFGEEIFPESLLANKFRTLDNTQAAIEDAAALAAKYPYPPGALMQLMHDVFVSIPTNSAVTRLGIFYVYNHLIHQFGKSSWTHPISFIETGLERFCIPAISHSNRIKCTNAVHIITCINVWRKRHIYSAQTCDQLEALVTSSESAPSSIEAHTDTNTYTVNSEVGGVKTLGHIIAMPLVDGSFEEATSGVDESSILDPEGPLHEQSLAEAAASGKYEQFDYASRLSGQELILLHSSSLDLAALIEEGTKHIDMLHNEIVELESLIRNA
ncbi:asparagine-rich protein, putative [Babesia caballi]|uniref:Asparagine-rich protein, putative n=1 Tax=Babesia caballi TaxID=5871 RepID=A0AAV4LYM1_BABCB|nr:asparagine-rich protein, putative [Babesia caballi]